MTAGESLVDEYLVRGLARCGVCGRVMVAVRHLDGGRVYSCGPGCRQRDLPAVCVEQDLLLRALVRAHAVLYGVGRSAGVGLGQRIASAEEVRRWQWCDVSDRRAVLRAAFTRVTVDGDGRIHPVWRYETDTAPDTRSR